MNNPKSGIATTEFWVIVVSSLLAVAVAAGYVSPEQAGQVTDATAQVLNSIAELIKAVAPVAGPVMYVWSRTKVKTAVM